MIKFSEIIKKIREQLSMSIEEFALNFDVSESQVKAWESGRRYPSIDTINRLLSMLGLTLEEFISDYCNDSDINNNGIV